MSLPEIYNREDHQIKMLSEIEKKLDSIIVLICGKGPPVDLAEQRNATTPGIDGFIASTLFQQEIVNTKLNNLHIRLDDFRSMLGHGEEVAEKRLNRGLTADLERELKDVNKDWPRDSYSRPINSGVLDANR